MSIYQKIKANVDSNPEQVAIISPTTTVSYQQLISKVDQVASQLQKYSSGHPVRVALHLKNSVELLYCAIAGAKLGWIIIPLNLSLRPSQLRTQLHATQSDLVITTRFGERAINKAVDGQKVITTDTLLQDDVAEGITQQTVPDIHAAYIITLSSGSTGQPKPIVLSQHSKLLRAAQAQACYQVTEKDRIICASPFYHSLGQRLCFVPLTAGATLVLLEHFTVEAWLDAVKQHKVSFTIAVSSHLQALKQYLLDDPELTSLRCLVSSSAEINYTLKQTLLAKLNCEFHEMYGATEIATATNLSPFDDASKAGSVGHPIPPVELKILNEDRLELPPNEVGEIACKTPLLFNGYDKLDELTQASMHDGYFLTGDLGYLDSDGYLYYSTRKKDIIITGGINVIPQDIEAILRCHEAVNDCCVIGVPDGYLGEVVFAVCALTKESKEIETELRLYLNERLAGFQQPMGYAFVPEIPLTGSGKPDKQKLRDDFSDIRSEKRATD